MKIISKSKKENIGGKMKTEYTEGPWIFDGRNIKNTEGDWIIATYVTRNTGYGWHSPTFEKQQDKANARLISAAPELFKLCVHAEKIMSGNLKDPDIQGFADELKKAIAKATRGEK